MRNSKIITIKFLKYPKMTEASDCPKLQNDNLGGEPMYHPFNLSS